MRRLAIVTETANGPLVERVLTEQETLDLRHGLVQQQFKLFDELREATSTSETFSKRLSSVRNRLEAVEAIQSLLVELAE